MRIINGVLFVLLILFAAVQYNDPDGVFWAVVYGVGAAWCGLAAFRPAILAGGAARVMFLASFAACLFGVVWFWPTTPDWWMQDVWWNTETAREGMGMMILLVALLAAAPLAVRASRG